MDEQRNWNQAVMRNARGLSAHFRCAAGHTASKIWRLDDNVVLQRVVAAVGGVPPSLGLLNGLTSHGRVSGCAR